MSRRAKPTHEQAFAFLKSRLGKHCLAPCTGQDYVALRAWLYLVELWGVGDYAARDAAVPALSHVLDGMQRSVWPLAKAGIPGVLDWSHENQLWSEIHHWRNRLEDAAMVARSRVPPLQGGDGATGMSRDPAGRES